MNLRFIFCLLRKLLASLAAPVTPGFANGATIKSKTGEACFLMRSIKPSEARTILWKGAQAIHLA